MQEAKSLSRNEIQKPMYYYCNLCKYNAVIRKDIRLHLKHKHGMKGKRKGGLDSDREPLSAHYERR